MFNANNLIDTIILIGIIILVIALVIGVTSAIGTVNWKKHIEVGQCTAYGDELFLVLERNYKSDKNFTIESITLKITPSSGLPFNYTFKPDRNIGPGNNASFYVSADEIFKGKDKTIEDCRVVKVKLVKADK